MSGLARGLAPALPWVLLLIVLVLLAIAAILYGVMRRARRRAAMPPGGDADDDDADAGNGGAKETRFLPLGAGRSFARAMALLRRYVPGRDARYRIPWVVLMGPCGAGSSTVARAVDLPRPFPAPDGADHGDPDVRWEFFEQGVLLDVPGAWVQERGGAGNDEQGWRTFLRLLERWRPDRPLDAVVLTIPADLLAGPGAPVRRELLARAEALRERLWEAQRRLGLRFPVHVLVTRCDHVAGFGAVCRELPEAARHEIFGWSSPFPLEAAFEPKWVEQAFDAVHHDLYEAQVELLAGCDPAAADGVFRFPGELRRLLPPLGGFLGELFRESAYREAFFFRGIYFTGDPAALGPEEAPAPAAWASPAAPGAVSADGDDPATPPSARAAPRPGGAGEDDALCSPVFLRHLFAERIFAESGLARLEGGVSRARGRWARAAQAAAAALVVIGLPGLILAHARLETMGDGTARSLRQAMGVADVLDREGEGRTPGSTGRVGVVALADRLASLPADELWSPFIPQSWTGSLRRQVERAQAAAFADAVLPAMRRRLLDRADRLLPADAAVGLPADPGPEALPGYLRELGAMSLNVNRYNRLATPDSADPADLEGLAAYLYAEHAPPRSGRAGAYRRALRLATAQRLGGDRTWLAQERAGFLTERVYAGLSTTLAGLEDRLGATGDPGAVLPDGTARGTGFDPGRLGSAFAAGDSAWLSPSAPVPASVDSTLRAIPASALLSAPRLRGEVQSRFASVRRAQLAGLETQPGGGDAAASPAAGSLVALRDALAQLRGQSFADPGPPVRLMEVRVPASAPVAWDTAALSRALARYDACGAFLAGPQVAALSPRGRALVRTLAAQQLEAGMSRDVARAARPASFSSAGALAYGAERELRARAGSLAPAAGPLARVAAAYSAAGRMDAYDDLASFSAAQGGALLGAATALLDAQGAYVPRDGGFAWWRGESPVSYPAFGVHDPTGLDDYLAAQRAGVTAAYTAYAEPVLALLYSDALAPFLAAPPPDAAQAARAAAGWKAMGDVLAAYEAKKPSSLARLETLIQAGMASAGPGSCAPVAAGISGSDWFAARARSIQAPLYARCRQLSGAWARDGYEQIRSAFSTSLAGRFPFAPSDVRTDADPAAVAAFLATYAGLAAARSSVLGGRDGVGGPGSAAAAFLQRMDQAAAFLAPLVAADTGGGPAYRVSAAFRVNRAREIGADQVADWSLQVGDDRLTPRDSAGAAAGWSPGEGVALAFRWAAGSPVRPSPTGLPAGARADGATLGYAYGGSWSLLRLLRARAAPPRLLSASPERVAHTLAFAAATVAAPQPVRVAATGGAAPGEALFFVRVDVLDPATGRALVLPGFPTTAPALGAGDEP